VIGLDTNVLVRFLTQDDPAQAAQATALIATLTEDRPGFLSREVMLETVWVLYGSYTYSRMEIADALSAVLEAREFVVEDPSRVARALERYRQGGAGFADHMIALAGEAVGCETVMTFDRKAARAEGFTEM